MVAALFVEKGGVYYGLPDVDPWDEARDARLYAGPWPVVAHPPCARWSMLAAVVQARYGHRIGDDGGCFASALNSVRTWGGVLEHPAESKAWPAFNLPRPVYGAWTRGLFDGEWVTQVAQRNYGHRATKQTWLVAVGDPPALDWREPSPPLADPSTPRPTAEMDVEHMGKKERMRTPIAFRDLLLSISRSARRQAA